MMKPPHRVSLGFLSALSILSAVVSCASLAVGSPVAAAVYLSKPLDVGVSSVGGSRVIDPSTLAESWRQFRGPSARGITTRADLPKAWSGTESILWEAELPGRGASSPIAHFQRIFVTSSSGYGEDLGMPGEPRYLKHHLLCLDASSGKTMWRIDINGSPLAPELNRQILEHGLATSTPVTDGSNVYAFFGSSGVFAFDGRGRRLWHADVGFEPSKFGSAASPIMFDDLLIINASAESGSVIALDKKTGRGVWRIDDVIDSWSTPVVGKNKKGEPELIVCDAGRVRGFDPRSGTELWQCDAPDGYAATTPFLDQGICYYTAGLSRTLMAIQIGGSGNVTDSHLMWQVNNASRHTSPIYLTGYVYVLSESGIFKCFRAKDGSLVTAKRLPSAGRIFSSPVLMGNYFYLPTGGNRVFVCRASSDLEMLRDNRINEQEQLLASICPSANSLLIRTDGRLRCIYESDRATQVVKQNEVPDPIQVAWRYDFDPGSEKIRKYNEFLRRDPATRADALLEPLKTQLDSDGVREARQLLLKPENVAELEQLLQEQRIAYWQHLSGRDTSTEQLAAELADIELRTLETVRQIQQGILKRLGAGNSIVRN